MTYVEEARLEAIYNGGYEKSSGYSNYQEYEESALDFDRDEYVASQDDSGTASSMHFE